MAGVSMKDIKLRIRSMESTKQITKAMEMVAASKLRRAQERAQRSRPYFEALSRRLRTLPPGAGIRIRPISVPMVPEQSARLSLPATAGLPEATTTTSSGWPGRTWPDRRAWCCPSGKRHWNTSLPMDTRC